MDSLTSLVNRSRSFRRLANAVVPLLLIVVAMDGGRLPAQKKPGDDTGALVIMVPVPDVVGLKHPDALASLSSFTHKCIREDGVPGEPPADTIDRWKVRKQDPEAGTPVSLGSLVTLTVYDPGGGPGSLFVPRFSFDSILSFIIIVLLFRVLRKLPKPPGPKPY